MNNFSQIGCDAVAGKKLVSKRIRWAANGVGFYMAFYIFTSYVLQYIILGIIKMFAGSVYAQYSLLTGDFLYYLQIFVSVTSVLLPGLVYVLFSKQNLSELVPIKPVKPSVLIPTVFAGLAVAMIANFAVSILTENLSVFGISDKSNSDIISQGFDNLFLDIIATAVVPAIVEEFALRGIFMGAMRKFGDPVAIITSSIIFSLLHGNLSQIPFAFILGLALGYAACKTNSLIPSILIHFLNNFYAVISAAIISNGKSESLSGYIISIIIALSICLISLVSLIYLLCKKKDFFRFDRKSESVLSIKEQLIPAIINPGIIISLSICIYITVINSGFSI